jgi:opacity protein-like surface antigen
MKKLLVLFLFTSVPALGSTNQIDFLWGRSSPQGSIQANGSTEQDGLRGTSWSFDALHQASEYFYLGFGFGDFSSADNNSTTFIPGNTVSTIDSQKTSTLILGRMNLGASSHFLPYAIAGLGWVKNSMTVYNSGQGTVIDDSKSTFGYAGGLGVDLLLTDRLILGMEARYEGSPAQHFGMSAAGAAASGVTDVRTSANLFTVALKAGVKY